MLQESRAMLTRCAAVAAAAALPILWGLDAGVQAYQPPPQELNLLSADMYAGNSSGRDGRIFHFSKEDTAIRVELAFAIPFLSIPVGGNKAQGGALVDVNVGALAAGGVFTIAAMMFIPHLFEGLSPMIGFGRSEGGPGAWGAAVARVDELLREQNVDARACAQRALCSFVASSFEKLQRGTPGSVDKIVDGVISNEWLSNAVRNSPFQEAIDSGKYGGNCSALYSSCPVTQRGLKNMAINIAKMIKS